MAQRLDNPFYYLNNFEFVLNWLEQRYADVLDSNEQCFLQQYRGLPRASRALLVRMVMRRGVLFRHSRLHYAEIGAVGPALAPLVQAGWVDANPLLNLEQLFGLFTKAELLRAFSRHALPPTLSKAALYDRLSEALSACADATPTPCASGASAALPARSPGSNPPALPARCPASNPPAPQIADRALSLRQWWPDADDEACELLIMPLCERFRLMFFGNLHQDWSEFVLADLGLLRYETVPLSVSCRALARRQDVDDYLHLHRCAESLLQGEDPATVMARVPMYAHANGWIERRRAKLLFRIGQAFERSADWDGALQAYGESGHAEARVRRVRVLERAMRYEPALKATEAALREPAGEAETQQLARIYPRLRRKLGLPVQRRPKGRAPATILLQARAAEATHGVEELARRYLHRDEAPAHYVENTLVTALFGLLCWDALFAPLPGAFFHPFQRGPADLREPDFVRRRQALFDACLAQLDSDQYLHTIQSNLRNKAGRQCAFVHWPAIGPELLQQALCCIPPAHMKKWFVRLLADLPGNRSGLPDLIQFWPAEKRYHMVEVKGPGDRLQDNQQRWLAYFSEHDMPVSVCLVRWEDSP